MKHIRIFLCIASLSSSLLCMKINDNDVVTLKGYEDDAQEQTIKYKFAKRSETIKQLR